MANKEDKARIWQLLDKGVSIGEIEKTSKTPRRTLYRWYSDWRESKKEDEPPIINEAVKEVKNQVENQLNVNFNDDWASVATKQSIEHSLVNGQIARALSNILIKEIQKKDLNYRAIGALSASISVHSKLHREYGLFYLLDINKAFKLIENEGYSIIADEKPADPAAE